MKPVEAHPRFGVVPGLWNRFPFCAAPAALVLCRRSHSHPDALHPLECAAATAGVLNQLHSDTSIFQKPLNSNRAIECAPHNECQEENPFTSSSVCGSTLLHQSSTRFSGG
jgi:hypothetical protein